LANARRALQDLSSLDTSDLGRDAALDVPTNPDCMPFPLMSKSRTRLFLADKARHLFEP
jgi:hypothetical protein